MDTNMDGFGIKCKIFKTKNKKKEYDNKINFLIGKFRRFS